MPVPGEDVRASPHDDRRDAGAEIERIVASEINVAYERVLDSDVRYRFVIGTATI